MGRILDQQKKIEELRAELPIASKARKSFVKEYLELLEVISKYNFKQEAKKEPRKLYESLFGGSHERSGF